ncbi:MAG: arylsulfatase [Pantoea sp.]|uniref:arylsulfatase n=2 Tax=Pantoea septica TaxID=472695 RepID=UPI0023F39A52|nr:arylsulfatase [Pantoea septica]MDU5835532.1 arylsulfatase [Pantoea sp.]MDU6438401.1 arylsulfatase [Pantoea sp.]
MSQRIVLIHATPLAVAPVNNTFARQWPEAEIANLLDDALSGDRGKVGALTPEFYQRIDALVDYALSMHAAAILFTCSALGEAIDASAQRHALPVLKPNEAMFEAALDRGNDILMLATFAPAVASMEAEFYQLAAARGSAATLKTLVVAGARDALSAGDIALHNQLVVEAARQNQHVDAIVLAHFSMEVAFEAASAAVDCPLLSSAQSAVAKLKRLMN